MESRGKLIRATLLGYGHEGMVLWARPEEWWGLAALVAKMREVCNVRDMWKIEEMDWVAAE